MRRGVWTLFTAALLMTCSDSVIGPGEAIVGSWRTAQSGATVTWTFQAGGSLRIVTDSTQNGTSFFTTTYQVDGDKVTLRAFTGSDDKANAVSFPAATCTVDITDRTMRLSCPTGVTVFSRVGPGSEDNAV